MLATLCAPLSPNPSPLLSERLHWRSPADSDPVLRWYRPDTINLRSSAFICGSFFEDAPRFLVKSSLTIEENILNTFTQLGGMLNIPFSMKASWKTH
ncbi:Uncharacterised protein [uncultured archaeon]|nr:Uncharacterised protein [uncultured archaeon]